MKVMLVVALVLAAAYVALIGYLAWNQDRFLFAGSPDRANASDAGIAGLRDIMLNTGDGERLVAWWKPPEPGRALLVYFHGNGGSLKNRRDRAKLLTEDGRGLLLVSYRGYSGSTGKPSEAGLARDAEAAYAFLASYAPGRIVLYGESLGSAVAVRLASDHPVGGVILDAPFTSVEDVAQPIFWFVPVRLLLRAPFRSIDRIARIGAPLLVMHGEADGLIPIALGRRLFAAAAEPKRFVGLPGVDHVSVLERGGLEPVRGFLSEIEATFAAASPAVGP